MCFLKDIGPLGCREWMLVFMLVVRLRWSSHVLIEPLMVVSVVVLGFLFKGWLSKQIFVSSFNDISTFN